MTKTRRTIKNSDVRSRLAIAETRISETAWLVRAIIVIELAQFFAG